MDNKLITEKIWNLGNIFFDVFIEAIKSLIISSISPFKELYKSSSKYAVLCNNVNQYDASLASFRDMLSLLIKSGLLCACSPSWIFAPTLVALLNNCLDIINSRFSSFKYS